MPASLSAYSTKRRLSTHKEKDMTSSPPKKKRKMSNIVHNGFLSVRRAGKKLCSVV
jgi:hypothetical protein